LSILHQWLVRTQSGQKMLCLHLGLLTCWHWRQRVSCKLCLHFYVL